MGDAFAWAAGPAIACGAVLSLSVEHGLKPRPVAFWRRPRAALALHAGLWLLLVSVVLLVVWRPIFAVMTVLAGQLFLVLVSNAKYHALREPFIFQDFEYFSDALRHPRLYLPFLGAGRAVVAASGVCAAVSGGLLLERVVLVDVSSEAFLVGCGVFIASGGWLIAWGRSRLPPPTLDAEHDVRTLGLVAALWSYGEAELRPCSPIATRSPYRFPADSSQVSRPTATLVVVQSESFFDPRPLYCGIRPTVLSAVDALRTRAVCHGPLTVAAWGANTVRTEFAFLSGLAAESLGVHRFNPYRRIARHDVVTLASVLRRHGYRTLCVHPYAASFYARDRVYGHLGFDEFVDLRSFSTAARCGPYVADWEVAKYVRGRLEQASSQPLFVFVITMENHGPLHLENVTAEDVERFYSTPPPIGCDDLTIYLRHLANADRMADSLRQTLASLPGPSYLCWYGDHVPIMPETYRLLGTPDGRTDYFIWRTDGEPGSGECQGKRVEELGPLLWQLLSRAETDHRSA